MSGYGVSLTTIRLGHLVSENQGKRTYALTILGKTSITKFCMAIPNSHPARHPRISDLLESHKIPTVSAPPTKKMPKRWYCVLVRGREDVTRLGVRLGRDSCNKLERWGRSIGNTMIVADVAVVATVYLGYWQRDETGCQSQ
jgi:hypothetical protein